MIQTLDVSLFHPLPDLKYSRLKRREAKNAERTLHIASPLLPKKMLRIHKFFGDFYELQLGLSSNEYAFCIFT